MQDVHANLNPGLPWQRKTFHQQIGLNLRMKLVKCYICSHVWWELRHLGKWIRNTWKVLKCGAGEGRRGSIEPSVWEIKQCYVESKGRSILHTLKKRKANWIGHIWRRSCLLKHVIGGKIGRRIEVTRRRGRRRTHLLDDIKETRGRWILKVEALDRTVWSPHHGRDCGPAVRQTRMNRVWLKCCETYKMWVGSKSDFTSLTIGSAASCKSFRK